MTEKVHSLPLFCCHAVLRMHNSPHTPTDINLNLTTNLKQATNSVMKSFKIR